MLPHLSVLPTLRHRAIVLGAPLGMQAEKAHQVAAVAAVALGALVAVLIVHVQLLNFSTALADAARVIAACGML